MRAAKVGTNAKGMCSNARQMVKMRTSNVVGAASSARIETALVTTLFEDSQKKA